MATRMLIDARHPEETRVAVLKGNRIEEFDFESADHKQIKGNIYLAKVTRVEPSLQAAFVDFGGNRHGFLAFSEIHPDYYQIPAADREALLAEEQAHADEEAALRAAEEDREDADYPEGLDDEDDLGGDGVEEIDTSEKDEIATIEDGRVAEDGADTGADDRAADYDTGENDTAENDTGDDGAGEDGAGDDDAGEEAADYDDEGADDESGEKSQRGGNRRGRNRRQGRGGERGGDKSRAKEMDELRAKRQALRRRYKIQDVIQRRQVLLVQVVKEERGNKGAALTSYLSLAGRYCVLMPNSSHGGGISRKISSGADRKRLKQIVAELSLPKSMGLIVRTAGLQRNKTEIKRDFDYLARLWDEIRETTLASSAPAVIHSDSDLVKRAIRDIYNREIEEVVVEGEEGYKAAKQFMKLLMPSHARRVKAYSDPVPLFQRYGAEDQLSAMYDPMVQLKSGGYLVINPTEALVSIDINSGRSTKEHGIEQTALATNLEAAREIARQLRLRDMAGLVVIDFIDMEHSSNVRKVEKCVKDALKNDRARIQVGRISSFGLMEMSRQRLRTGVLEATTRTCPHCDGTGLVRTASSAGLSALRMIEDEAAKGKGSVITLFASTEAAVYLLNAKRADLAEIEHRYNVSVEVYPEGEDEGAKMRIQSSGPRPTEAPKFAPIIDDEDDVLDIDDDEDAEEDEEDAGEEETGEDTKSREQSDEEDGGQPKKRKRRRRGGRGRNRNRSDEEGEDGAPGEEQDTASDDAATDETSSDEPSSDEPTSDEGENESEAEPEGGSTRRRRRGGGRRRQQETERTEAAEDSPAETDSSVAAEETEEAATAAAPSDMSEPAEAASANEPAEASGAADATEEAVAQEAPAKPARRPRRAKASAKESTVAEDGAPAKPRPRTRRRKTEEPDAADKNAQDAAKDSGSGEPEAGPTAAPASEEAPELASAASDVAVESRPATDMLNESAEGDEGSSSPRRGWWQRTFGA